jgi:hypothetical protein
MFEICVDIGMHRPVEIAATPSKNIQPDFPIAGAGE